MSSRNELAWLQGDALKLRLTTPPVDGRANKAVISFPAKLLKIPKSAILIKNGLRSRSKKLVLSRVHEDQVRRLLGERIRIHHRTTFKGMIRHELAA